MEYSKHDFPDQFVPNLGTNKTKYTKYKIFHCFTFYFAYFYYLFCGVKHKIEFKAFLCKDVFVPRIVPLHDCVGQSGFCSNLRSLFGVSQPAQSSFKN